MGVITPLNRSRYPSIRSPILIRWSSALAEMLDVLHRQAMDLEVVEGQVASLGVDAVEIQPEELTGCEQLDDGVSLVAAGDRPTRGQYSLHREILPLRSRGGTDSRREDERSAVRQELLSRYG